MCHLCAVLIHRSHLHAHVSNSLILLFYHFPHMADSEYHLYFMSEGFLFIIIIIILCLCFEYVKFLLS